MIADIGSRAETYLSWVRLLKDLRLLVTVGTDVIVLGHVFPAFRRTSNKAFLFIAIACVMGIIGTVYTHTINYRGLSIDTTFLLSTLHDFWYFADSILWCAGIVLLARPYLYSPSTLEAQGSASAHPDVPSNSGSAEPMGRPEAGEDPPVT